MLNYIWLACAIRLQVLYHIRFIHYICLQPCCANPVTFFTLPHLPLPTGCDAANAGVHEVLQEGQAVAGEADVVRLFP